MTIGQFDGWLGIMSLGSSLDPVKCGNKSSPRWTLSKTFGRRGWVFQISNFDLKASCVHINSSARKCSILLGVWVDRCLLSAWISHAAHLELLLDRLDPRDTLVIFPPRPCPLFSLMMSSHQRSSEDMVSRGFIRANVSTLSWWWWWRDNCCRRPQRTWWCWGSCRWCRPPRCWRRGSCCHSARLLM